MPRFVNLGNGWLINVDEIRWVRPIKVSEQSNKSTVTLRDGEKIHTVLTADQIQAQIDGSLLTQTDA